MRLSLASYLYVGSVVSAVLREGNPVVLRVDVEVPAFAVAGGQATLGCSFRLTGTQVYSLKWYHNGTEFYRFVPTERAQAIRTQPSAGFSVTEVFRGDQLVTLSLFHLTSSASGRYLCEVMAEHPSFLKEAATGKMTVLPPLSPPVTAGERQFYHRSEEIEIKCHPRHASPPGHTPVLHWLIDGRLVATDLLRSLPARRPQHAPGVALHLPAERVAAAGGRVRAECRISMGPHARPHSTFITLTVPDSHNLQSSQALPLAGVSGNQLDSWVNVYLLSGVFVLQIVLLW
ncbi:uncharacterized protein LOC127006887 [Eriocheir sinensis]|uniref:uncharacterized protein LOC127006887 n=1 Tax=Eriocheir sinensis TaxID=95602 RepID=UPI0021C99AC5|nr:uncharacterized protein LOC127006887 [Eriocheir sinensis]